MYTAHATRIINRNTEKINFHDIIAFDYRIGVFEVKTGRGTIQHVDLNQTKCTCKKLEIYHLRCSHILVVCIKRHLSYERFVDPCYTSQSYASIYEHYFMPMIDKRSWPQYTGFDLRHHPDQIRGKRRPKSRRIANEMDEGRR